MISSSAILIPALFSGNGCVGRLRQQRRKAVSQIIIDPPACSDGEAVKDPATSIKGNTGNVMDVTIKEASGLV